MTLVLHDRDASFTAAFGAVFQAAGVRIVRSAVQASRMSWVMERRIGSCRRELLDRTLIWNKRHLIIVLREYEDFCNTHRPHRGLNQVAPPRPLPDGVTGLDQFRVQWHDRGGGVIHEYRLVDRFSAPTGLRILAHPGHSGPLVPHPQLSRLSTKPRPHSTRRHHQRPGRQTRKPLAASHTARHSNRSLRNGSDAREWTHSQSVTNRSISLRLSARDESVK
jgi:hypothetical protein